MKLTRLYQPRNPLFWLMLAFNGLSPMLAWIVHNRPLNMPATLMVAFFALGNAVLGTWLAWRLMRDEPAAPPETARQTHPPTPQDKLG